MPGIAPGAEDTAVNKTDSQKKKKEKKFPGLVKLML